MVRGRACKFKWAPVSERAGRESAAAVVPNVDFGKIQHTDRLSRKYLAEVADEKRALHHCAVRLAGQGAEVIHEGAPLGLAGKLGRIHLRKMIIKKGERINLSKKG